MERKQRRKWAREAPRGVGCLVAGESMSSGDCSKTTCGAVLSMQLAAAATQDFDSPRSQSVPSEVAELNWPSVS
jgi:hypothetical protein